MNGLVFLMWLSWALRSSRRFILDLHYSRSDEFECRYQINRVLDREFISFFAVLVTGNEVDLKEATLLSHVVHDVQRLLIKPQHICEKGQGQRRHSHCCI